MLQIATTTALGNVFARRLNSLLASFKHFGHDATGVILLLLEHLGNNKFTRQSTLNENNPTVLQMAEAITLSDHLFDTYLNFEIG